MTTGTSARARVREHWAVAAIPAADEALAFEAAKYRRVSAAIGPLLHVDEGRPSAEIDVVERVALAYELVAVDGIQDLMYPQREGANVRDRAQAGAGLAFELRASLPLSVERRERMYQILHLAALAYAGDRWADLRRWLSDHSAEAKAAGTQPDDAEWDDRILSAVYRCWVSLLRKESWRDLEGVATSVADLREHQALFEDGFLGARKGSEKRSAAFRLLALYHWARATELLGSYMLQGTPATVPAELDQHYEAARDAARGAADATLDVVLRWLHVASRRMVAGSVWWVASVTPQTRDFVRSLTRTGRPVFELLPPQRAALHEQGLLDPASRAVVVDLPTSAGKTTLAEFRMLQALNQFSATDGWIAYVAPTRALVNQVARKLRQDFGALNIRVEQLTAAIDTDALEDTLLKETGNEPFRVLVLTPEKLQLIVRNKKVPRPLVLLVLDEAHNIEDPDRGLRIELLLATVKRECADARFLLMVPNVPNASDLTTWLAPEDGKTISLGTSGWQPNERIVGAYRLVPEADRGSWSLGFETLTTSPGTVQLQGTHKVGPVRPLSLSRSAAKSRTALTGAMARVFSERGTSIGVARSPKDVWSMARRVAGDLPAVDPVPEEIALVQRFLAAEIGPEFELIGMLAKGVAVHHSGISDDTRALVEWLAELGLLKVLCATTSIAQGINFPVSSVFLASRFLPARQPREMSKRAFWNLAGRAGRIDQASIGVVGLAEDGDGAEIRQYVADATGELVSRLIRMLDDLEARQKLDQLSLVIHDEAWTDFRSFVAHLWAEKNNLDAVIAETEILLRSTFGYDELRRGNDERARGKARALLDATKSYARSLAQHPGSATLADATGFAPEGVRKALAELSQMGRPLTQADWQPSSVFGDVGASQLPNLIGVMMQIPQLKDLSEIAGHGLDESRVAEIALAWVDGRSISEIAAQYFSGTQNRRVAVTDAITSACRAIYRHLANEATWGLSALSKLPASGLNYTAMSEEERRQVNLLPAMLYHGVRSEAAVLMRMNSVPRVLAEPMGALLRRRAGDEGARSPTRARVFLRELQDGDWGAVLPDPAKNAGLSGADARRVWGRLSGELV